MQATLGEDSEYEPGGIPLPGAEDPQCDIPDLASENRVTPLQDVP